MTSLTEARVLAEEQACADVLRRHFLSQTRGKPELEMSLLEMWQFMGTQIALPILVSFVSSVL
jgi:hypothetical protein